MSFYETLEIGPDASPEVIRAAYRRLMQRHHPDRHSGDPRAAAKAQQIAQAFQVLSDPGLRARYDCERATPLPVVSRFAGVRRVLKLRIPRITASRAKVALIIFSLAVLVAAGGLLVQRSNELALAQQSLEQRHADAARQEESERAQQQELEEESRAAEQADAEDKARRTIPFVPVHSYVDIYNKGAVQGFILPPTDVFIRPESSEMVASNISQRRAILRAAVLHELRQMKSGELQAASAEETLSASIKKVLNRSILGGERALICRRDIDDYACRGVESVIFRGTIELVPN